MFDKEYYFKGKHADIVITLTSQFNSDINSKLFQRNIDIYLIAPIIGFLYGRKAEVSIGTERVINHTQLIYEKLNLIFNYRLIMMLDKNNEPDELERINKAFRYINTDKATDDENLYESYVRGGIEILNEKLILPSKNPEDYILNLYDFLEEFDERYNQATDAIDIIKLCNIARN